MLLRYALCLLQGVNTAELTPSSTDANVQLPVVSSQSTITITLTGCDGSSGFNEDVPLAPTPTPAAAWPPVAPVAPPAPTPTQVPSGQWRRQEGAMPGMAMRVWRCQVCMIHPLLHLL